MGRRGRPELAAVVASSLLAIGSAHAADDEGHALHLAYVVPTSCPDERAFRGEVERRTDRVFWATRATSDMRADIRIEEKKGGFVATIGIAGAEGETQRNLDGKRCDEIAAATAFIVALAADPTVMTRPQPTNPFAESLGPPPPLPPSVLGAGSPGIPSSNVQVEERPRPGLYPSGGLGIAPPLPITSPTEARERDLAFGIIADATLDAGATPSPLLGFTGGVALTGELFRVRAAFGYAATPTWTATGGPDGLAPADATFALVRGRVEGCIPRLSPAPVFSFFPCARFELGSIASTLVRDGAPAGPDPDALWAAPGVGGLFLVEPIQELSLALSAGIAIPVRRTRYLETNLQLYEAWPVVPQVAIEVGVFP